MTIKTVGSLNLFKTKLCTRNTNTLKSCFLSYGPRHLNILHCRLRNRASSLNFDLFRANLTNSASCSCGHPSKDSFHYFLQCNNHIQIRNTLLTDLSWYPGDISIDVLLNGDTRLSSAENSLLARAVQKYIAASERFG